MGSVTTGVRGRSTASVRQEPVQIVRTAQVIFRCRMCLKRRRASCVRFRTAEQFVEDVIQKEENLGGKFIVLDEGMTGHCFG